jgi:hypothetical protein
LISSDERHHTNQAGNDDGPIKATAVEMEIAVADTAVTTSAYFNKWTKEEAGQLVGPISIKQAMMAKPSQQQQRRRKQQ